MKNIFKVEYRVLGESPISRLLFANTKMAWVWLVVRVYLGWVWVNAAWGKITNPAWVGEDAGQALTGFIASALARAEGERPDVQGWYAWFLQNVMLPHADVWGYIIAFGQMIIGILLIVGLFTGIMAFFGLTLNMNFLLAGAVSTNPIMVMLGVLLVLAWRVAGYIGLDRFALPALGTPWNPGTVFKKEDKKEK